MPVEYRKRKDATLTETTMEPATPHHSSITGNSVGYDSDVSFPSIGSSVLELEKRTTRSETAKQKCQQKRKHHKKFSVGIPSAVEQGQERQSRLSKH
jgi:hypothetical protein